MLRKFKIILLVFVNLIFFCFTNNVQASENCKLYIEDITKYVNSNNVVVNIYMKNVNTQITTLGLNLEYDKSKLEFISSKAGKDLHATVKLAENKQEQGKVSIAALALDGFKSDGIYYSITFKVLDDSEEIPISLSKREITDKDGKDIDVEIAGTKIKISKETTNIEKSPENQKIQNFEINEKIEYDNLDTYIQEQGKIEVLGNDILVYETENNEVAEIQDDGTIIPVKDGTTNVRVRLNDDIVGNVAIDVKNNEVKSILATDEAKEFQASSSSQNVQLIERNIEEENKLAKTISIEKENEKENTIVKNVVIAILLVLSILGVYVILKKKLK